MDRERVELIVKNMDLLIQALKEEIKGPIEHNYSEIISYFDENDVDEYYEDKEDV